MDFFKHQEEARSESAKLLVLFILGTLLVIALTTVLLLPLFHYLFNVPIFHVSPSTLQVDYLDFTSRGLRIFKGVISFVVLSVGGGVLFKLIIMSRGGKSVAQMLKGVSLHQSGLSAQKKIEIKNITEEMGIASGIKPPAIYIINDKSINALAAGLEISDSVICLTTGAVDELSRDELSAVIAHEYGHILGSDARTNTYLAAVMHGLMMFTIMGEILFRGARHIRKDASILFIIMGTFFWLAGFIGRSVAGMIQSFYSQEREFLADACAVQFTRSKEGIIGVFQKLWWKRFHNNLRSPYAMEVAHFMFTTSTKRTEGSTSTHPTLKERAKRIDPSFRFKSFRPENFESKVVQTQIEKRQIEPESYSADALLDRLFKASSYSDLLNFSLSSLAVLSLSQQRFNSIQSALVSEIEKTNNDTLRFRYWLALEALKSKKEEIAGGRSIRIRRVYKRTHPLTYFEVELVLVFSAFIECTNSDYSARIRKHFQKTFPWCQSLIPIDKITADSFMRSLDKLCALNTDSKKVVYEFIREIINWDGRVSFEEEEFFKLLCEKLNMPRPTAAPGAR